MNFSYYKNLAFISRTCPPDLKNIMFSFITLHNYEITGWAKKTRPLYIFANIQHYIFHNIWQTTKDNYMIFLHTSRPVYSKRAYSIRVHSFYYLLWRHLVNHFPLDNATLKLQHHGVGRRLAHRKDKRCVCGTSYCGRGQGQQSILVMRSNLAKGYCFRARRGH